MHRTQLKRVHYHRHPEWKSAASLFHRGESRREERFDPEFPEHLQSHFKDSKRREAGLGHKNPVQSNLIQSV